MERNFDKLQIGHWYLTKEGCPEYIERQTVGTFPFHSMWQTYTETGASDHTPQSGDLVTEIEPPVFVPIKLKKKVKKYRLVYRSISGVLGITCNHYKSLEDFNNNVFAAKALCLLDFPETTIEVEEEQ